MLRILRNKHDKGIVIPLENGELIEIYITAYKGLKTEISIITPQNIKAWRGEIYDRKVAESKNSIK